MARTADLSDLAPGRTEPCCLPWRSYAVVAFAGEAATVRCRDDNVLVRQALEEPGRGRVLVVDGGGSLASALVGDVLGGLAVTNGWAGVVVVGAVRDVAALGGLQVGVVALGSVPRRAGRTGAGERDVPVAVGGAVVRPGDRVHVDEDGVLVERAPGGALTAP